MRDCQGIHYFKDPDDGEEYLYSQFESADAHKCFPCFDQPDLKAPYSLLVFAPENWVVVSTKTTKQISHKEDLAFTHSVVSFEVTNELYEAFGEEKIRAHEFLESWKISPYLYSVMAGPYHVFEGDQNAEIPQRIFCRKSIAKYVNKLVNTWFDVSIKCIKFYEEFFST